LWQNEIFGEAGGKEVRFLKYALNWRLGKKCEEMRKIFHIFLLFFLDVQSSFCDYDHVL